MIIKVKNGLFLSVLKCGEEPFCDSNSATCCCVFMHVDLCVDVTKVNNI